MARLWAITEPSLARNVSVHLISADTMSVCLLETLHPVCESLLSKLSVGAHGAKEVAHVMHIFEVGNQVTLSSALGDVGILHTGATAVHDVGGGVR